MALIAALGMVFSKIDLESYNPIGATQIRIIVATIAFIILYIYQGENGEK